jgi:pseudaminic acid biosynthesis-associated methylase
MSGPFKTEQEAFWAGAFGDAYVDRNQGAAWIASNTALFARVLERTKGVRSILEFGANIGLNIHALRALRPQAILATVEINPRASAELRKIPDVRVEQASMLEYRGEESYDLIVVKGVLIHLDPERLPDAYDVIYRTSARYVFIAEYYNPTPVAIPYRGYTNKLFKRDFAGEMLARFPDLRIVDYAFVYHGDPNFPQDDLTWFLMEKTVENG